MNIIIIEPFYSGSHKTWADAYQRHSHHAIQILQLKGRYWKWRMHGGAVSLAKMYLQKNIAPDLIIATDMLDLSTFLALTRQQTTSIPIALYFHENQLTYPWSPDDADKDKGRDRHYAFINITSALAANVVFFNSNYHLHSFLQALPSYLAAFPDYQEIDFIFNKIKNKSHVLSLGLDLHRFLPYKTDNKQPVPVILWNHRWEYDKNPELFFRTLFLLKKEGIYFKLIVLGESYQKIPSIFLEAKAILADEIIHFGFVNSFEEYARLLWLSDIIGVTSRQDFFGGSIVEAIFCNCYPILPFRLAYPEHIPFSFHAAHFYHSDEQFYTHLKNTIINFSSLCLIKPLSDFVNCYDWSNLAQHYDTQFSQVNL